MATGISNGGGHGPAARVHVLLSTYNGAKYLRAQLDSLVAQDYPDIRIMVRDDGSVDDTPSILAAYARQHDCMTIQRGPNLGVVGSFLELLKASADKADYLAFCDQDDVWEQDKVSRAVMALKDLDAGVPAMYFGRVKIVDDELKPISLSDPPTRGLAFENALVQNVAPGCSMLINRRAAQLIVANAPTADRVYMHDMWVYMVVSAFGNVVYDDQAHMSYRQHAGNVFGASSGMSLWWSRLRRLVGAGPRLGIAEQAREFERVFGFMLTDSHRKVINRLTEALGCGSMWRRLRYATRPDVFRQKRLDDWVLRLLIIGGRL